MILEVQYLDGVVRAGGATGGIGWPVEPGRLYAAMVNVWGIGGEDPQEERVLRWLEGARPPRITAPPLGQVSERRAFVPLNAVHTKGLEGYLPEGRNRQEKRFLSAPLLGEPLVRFHLEDPPEDLLPLLEGLATRVGRLGSSRSPVLVRLLQGEPPPLEGAETWVPVEGGGEKSLGVWYPGYLEALKERHRRLYGLLPPSRGKPQPAGRTWEPLPARLQGYRREPPPREEGPLLLGQAIALKPGLPLPLWPLVEARIRGRLGREEVRLLPLAFVGRRHADGRVLGVGVAYPPGLGPGARLELLSRVQGLWGGEEAFGPWRVALLPPDSRETLSPGRWQGPAQGWATVTPLPLPRGEGSVGARVEGLLRGAGLPAPLAFRAGPFPFLEGVPPAWEFQPYFPGPGPLYHLLLVFPHPVRGPLVLGEGGSGFLAPLEVRHGG